MNTKNWAIAAVNSEGERMLLYPEPKVSIPEPGMSISVML